jgi:hypothetical protein
LKLPNYFKIIILAFLALVLIYYNTTAIHIGLFGDEVYYFSRGKLMVELIDCLFRGDLEMSRELLLRIIDRGWFYPATSIFIVPALWISKSLMFVRVYMLILNALLVLWMLKYIRRIWPGDYQYIFLLFIPFSGTFLYSSMTCYGEAMAGKFLTLFALWWIDKFRRSSVELSIKDLVIISLMTVLIYCFRKNYILVLPLLFFLTAFFSYQKEAKMGQAVLQLSKLTLIFSFFFLLFIGPWAYGSKLKYGEYMISTTSTYTSRIRSYGSIDLRKKIMAAVPKSFENKNISLAMYHYYYERSKDENITFSEAVKDDLAQISEQMTWGRYLRYVKKHFRFMFKSPNVFPERWQSSYRKAMQRKKMDPNKTVFVLVDHVIVEFNTFFWYLFYVCALLYAIFAFFSTFSLESKITFLIIAGAFSASTIHPFFAQPHSRHTHGMWPMFFVIITHACVLIRGRLKFVSPHQMQVIGTPYMDIIMKIAAVLIAIYSIICFIFFLLA